MIKEVNGKFLLYSHKGDKVLGVHGSKWGAESQERAVKASEAKRDKGSSSGKRPARGRK